MKKLLGTIVFIGALFGARPLMAATLEEATIGAQIIQNLGRMVWNIRDNAAAYKIQAAKDSAKTAIVMKQDAALFAERIKWVTELEARSPEKYQGALTAIGLDKGEIAATVSTLQTVVEAVKTADLSDAQKIADQSDAILASVPDFERSSKEAGAVAAK